MTTTAFAQQIEAVDYDKIYSVEEYFELERHADIRHEFHYGKLIAMPGESIHANLVAGNIYIELRLGLHTQPGVVCNHDVKTIVRNKKISNSNELGGYIESCFFSCD